MQQARDREVHREIDIEQPTHQLFGRGRVAARIADTRCLLPIINAGIRILEEGVALRSSDIEVVWTAGYGFPRCRGGPLFYADTIGLQSVHEGIVKYRELFGPHALPAAPLLARLVREPCTLADWDKVRA